jgi:deoxyribodipyrimidine photo-lyase
MKYTFPTAYTAIQQRMSEIDPLTYGSTRNHINGSVTYLSPYISRGVISTRQVLKSVLSRGYPAQEIEKFIQELAWRDYFQRVWQAKGNAITEDIKQPQPDVIHHQMIEAVSNGHTGIEAVDAHLKQFYETGYLHNHVRMYIASMVCNIGKAHWRTPSQWMYYHLLDGDLASNNCSWQWVAGAFSSKKYYANQENINKYMFSSQRNTFLDVSYEELPTLPVPEKLKNTIDLTLSTTLPVLPSPVLYPNLPTLIYNSYNLDPTWRQTEKANRILLLEPTHFKRYPISPVVLQFILDVSKNISEIQYLVGEIDDVIKHVSQDSIVSKEHPAFRHYPGKKDERDWLFPHLQGYYPSFSAFWRKGNPQSYW